jgi:hypothetical protein
MKISREELINISYDKLCNTCRSFFKYLQVCLCDCLRCQIESLADFSIYNYAFSGLVSDAVHLTFGCGLLTFSLFVMGASRKKPDGDYTYG